MRDHTFDFVSVADIASDEKGAIAIGPFGSAMKADLYVDEGIPGRVTWSIINGNSVSEWVTPGANQYGNIKFVLLGIVQRNRLECMFGIASMRA